MFTLAEAAAPRYGREGVAAISASIAGAPRLRTPFAPSPVLAILRDAARPGDGAGAALLDVLAGDYPRSLERRPAQLVRAAGVASEDLDRLLLAAGFADLDDLRRQAARENGRRLIARDRRVVQQGDGAEDVSAGLERTLRREQENLAETLHALQSSGALELAAGAVLHSRHRWVFGDLKSRGYAHLFAADLASALGRVALVDPTSAAVLAAAGDAHRRDSLTVFCFRRYSRLSVRVARHFAELGATVVAVTDSEDSPVCAYATHSLRVVTRSDTVTHSPTAVTAIGHALAALATAGAKGAAKRAQTKQAFAAALGCYEETAS